MSDRGARQGKRPEVDKLLDVIKTWLETESGPSAAKFSIPALNVSVTFRGYKKLTLERTFGRRASQGREGE